MPTPSGFLVRLNANGSLDTSFTSGAGRYVYTGRYSYPEAVTTQATATGERIVAAGEKWESVNLQSNRTATVWRFTLPGARDDGFGEPIGPGPARSGFVRVYFHDPGFAGDFTDEFLDLTIDSSNRIVAAGYASDASQYRLILARFDTSGAPDQTFGTRGASAISTGYRTTVATGVALLPDGRILVADYSYNLDAVTFERAPVAAPTAATLDSVESPSVGAELCPCSQARIEASAYSRRRGYRST